MTSFVLVRLDGMSSTNGCWNGGLSVVGKNRQDRRGRSVVLYIKKRSNCTALAVNVGVADSLWVRIKEMDIKADVAKGVYYQPLTQNNSTDELFHKKFGKVFVSVALILMGDFNFSDINYKYHTVMRTESGKYKKRNV